MAVSRYLYEHCKEPLNYEGSNPYANIKPHCFYDKRGKPLDCFLIKEKHISANYYVGIDWLIQNEEYVYVAPKINTKAIRLFEEETETKDFDLTQNNSKTKQSFDKNRDYKELNYLKMYLDAALHSEIKRHTEGLLYVNWNAPEIKLNHKEQDLLTPFLIVQYLNLLKQIVRKRLKKSYYKVTDNLQGRIKGKILVGENTKTNIFKNKLINTVCQYQVFGVDNIENRFLKKVLSFVSNYIANNSALFNGNQVALSHMMAYCIPAFNSVSENYNENELKSLKTNAFFKEYKDAVNIGKQILKRFSYSISNTSNSIATTTPPFWIDMPRLFELYAYRQLLTVFQSKEIKYHFSTYGNELDFLITKKGAEVIVDAKYKLHYDKGHIHEDIRQVAGYARLNKVYEELDILNDELIPCLIIYPCVNAHDEFPLNSNLLNKSNEIRAYKKVHKIGVSLPLLLHK